jgi:putative transposase
MIDREHALPVSRQVRLVGIARSSAYYQPHPVSEADQKLMRRLDELHLEFPFAGTRMLVRLLKREAIRVGRKHVGTLMKRMGIEALYCKPNTSRRHAKHKIWPYLLRGMTINRANQVWALDTSYIPMARGFVYLTAVVDWVSRKVLAHLRSSTPTRAASSPRQRSPTPCSAGASACPWMAKAPGATTYSSNACGAA